jgi:hypothetical protein
MKTKWTRERNRNRNRKGSGHLSLSLCLFSLSLSLSVLSLKEVKRRKKRNQSLPTHNHTTNTKIQMGNIVNYSTASSFCSSELKNNLTLLLIVDRQNGHLLEKNSSTMNSFTRLTCLIAFSQDIHHRLCGHMGP